MTICNITGYVESHSSCTCCGKKDIPTITLECGGERVQLGVDCSARKLREPYSDTPRNRTYWRKAAMSLLAAQEMAVKLPGMNWETKKEVAVAF